MVAAGEHFHFQTQKFNRFIDNFTKVFRKAMRELGLDYNFHSLRHTFAVFCVSCGVSLRAIQKYLGHASIKTTEIYAAADPKFLEAEADKVSEGT